MVDYRSRMMTLAALGALVSAAGAGRHNVGFSNEVSWFGTKR